MRGLKLFHQYYEPKLEEIGVDNVVLRTYTHIKGLSTDDPNNSTELIFTPRQEVDERMSKIFSEIGEKKGIAITSIVSNNSTPRYLFLLDCSLKASPENEKELIGVLRNSFDHLPALKAGMVLRTKNSYHVVGFIPLSIEEWHAHMAQSLLLKTKSGEAIADVRYVGHSLERGYGSLRLSDYLRKPTPDFVCYFDERIL